MLLEWDQLTSIWNCLAQQGLPAGYDTVSFAALVGKSELPVTYQVALCPCSAVCARVTVTTRGVLHAIKPVCTGNDVDGCCTLA